MSVLLASVHYWVETLKAEGANALPTGDLAVLEARYQAIFSVIINLRLNRQTNLYHESKRRFCLPLTLNQYPSIPNLIRLP
jgi:hypothetical protein